MQYGEQNVAGQWYFLDQQNGDVKTGWYKLPDGRQVYYDVTKGDHQVSGRGMLHGQQDVGQVTYYFDDWNGAQVTGLKQVQGKTYYYAPAMVKNGEAYANGHWRYFGADGVMQTGFVQLKDGRKVYYDLQANGQGRGMLHGQQQLGDQIYYFNEWNGALHTNYAHYLAKVGKLQYYGSDGKLARRQVVRAGGQYQADELGYLALKLGENLVGTNWYLVSAAERLLTGWQVITGNRTVYYDPATAAMVKGERYLEGHWYYFNPVDGHRSTGLTQLPDGRYVYYAANGQMQYGRVQAGRITYFTNRASGAIEGVYNDAEVIGQNPELPTGCEITAVTMMLRYAGKDVNKIQLAREMPRSNDGNKGFVGDPFSVTGWWISPLGLPQWSITTSATVK